MEIGTVKLVNIEEEMRGAYLDYAMSVITSRALPDVRDGLKPVQRRILYAMDEIGLRHSSAYKKSARIVGEVLGKYHPHGDAPVYESMVRMAQDFSMRYPLVDGQGNFGSVDGDPPAAMRYTEARMAAIAEEMLADIDKNTVDFAPNFDGTLKEPTVLPAKIPNLLLNGSSGIAVGMATNIPPHNLNELVDAIVLMIDHFGSCLKAGVPFEIMWPRVLNVNVAPEVLASGVKSLPSQLAERIKAETLKASKRPTDEARGEALIGIVDEMIDITPDRLLEVVKGPDFPTAGIILGDEGIKNAYITGHGRITIRAKAHIEEMKGNRHQIIVTQLPYQVNKASLLEKIAELVRDRRVEGISELRDESDRQGMRIVIELRRDTKPTQILNQLFKFTAMQSAFSINMLALVDGQPRVLTLKMILLHYINYRKEVITRRTIFDLERARHRAHILQGLKIALDNLDEVISTIRKSRDAETARTALMKNFKLSEIQAQAILDMQLRRLAALERKKILDELAETLKLIGYLEDLLAHPGKILFLIKDELNEIKERYGDARRTRITAEAAEEFSEEDLIPDQEIVITVSAKGYVKRVPADSFRLQKRAKAIAGTVAREEDAPLIVVAASTLDQILFVTNRGRAYHVKAHELPDAGRQARGLPLSNFFSLQPEERAVGAVAVRNFDRPDYVLFVTKNGDVKRVSLSEYSSARSAGIVAINIAEGDELVFVGLGSGKNDLMVFSEEGQAIRFSEDEVRASGRASGGIRAIRLKDGDRVGAAGVVHGEEVVVVTQNGFHKRCALAEFPAQSRGGGGVRAQSVTPKTGRVAGGVVAKGGDEVLIVSSGGLIVRMPVDAVPAMGRSTQGAPLSGLEKNDRVAYVARVESREAPTRQPSAEAPDGRGGEGSAPSPKAGTKTGTKTRTKSGAKTGEKTAAKAASGKSISVGKVASKATGAGKAASSEDAKPKGRSKEAAAAAEATKPAPPAKVSTVKTVAKISTLTSPRPTKPSAPGVPKVDDAEAVGATAVLTNGGAARPDALAGAQASGVSTTDTKSAPSQVVTIDQDQEKAEAMKTPTRSKSAKPQGKSASSTKKVTPSKNVTTKVAKSNAVKPKGAKPVEKPGATVTVKKVPATKPGEAKTTRIVLPPKPALVEKSKTTQPKPSAGSTVSERAGQKDSKGKSSTLWGSIASSLERSVSGKQKATRPASKEPSKGKTTAQPSLPLFTDAREKKKEPSKASSSGAARPGSVSEKDKNPAKPAGKKDSAAPAAKAVKATTKTTKAAAPGKSPAKKPSRGK